MKIVDLARDEQLIQQVAEILKESFHGHCPDYDDINDALKKVREALEDHELNRIALDEEGRVIGWIGGIRQYNGHVWEIDPLVVRKQTQKSGVGRALIADFESIVKDLGADTIWLGTDDEDGRTSLANRDLYPDVWRHMRDIENYGKHPYEFYAKMGFVIVGVLPDANGPGKPDIYMAKKVRS